MKFLIGNINVENVLSLIQHCIDFETDPELVRKCSDFLLFRTEDVLNSEAFISISIKCLIHLLRAPCINVSEVDLFKAVSSFLN